MEYFIIEHNPLYHYNPQIINFQKDIDILKVNHNDTTHMKSRIILEFIGSEYTMFPDFLLERIPLVTKKIKLIMDIFYKNIVYKEIILKDKDSPYNQMYYFPKLHYFDSDIVLESENLKPKKIKSSQIINQDIFYIHYESELYLCANLMVVENIYRNGGHGFVVEKLYTE